MTISAVLLLIWAAAIHSVSAQSLLTINDSNPSAVIITATGANAGVNYSGNTANDGVDLLQFFTLNEFNMSFGQDLTGTLTGGNIGVSYDDVYSDNESTSGGNYFDMELYVDNNSPGEGNTETFSTSQPAFSGSWTIDFSALGVTGAALPTPGSTGSIMSGFSGSPGDIIGQWEIQAAPEPGTTSLALAGFAVTAIAMFRQRRRPAKK